MNKKNEVKKNKGRISFSFKKTEPNFINNAKKEINISQSSNALKNYENYFALKKDDDNKNEAKKDNKKNNEELGNSRIIEKFKSSSGSSDS